MKTVLLPAHKKRFAEIKEALTALGSSEGSFTRTELLFYEVLNIAHSYGDDLYSNALLAALKELQLVEYKATTAFFAKAAQREKTIRQFMYALKAILTKAGKGAFAMPAAAA